MPTVAKRQNMIMKQGIRLVTIQQKTKKFSVKFTYVYVMITRLQIYVQNTKLIKKALKDTLDCPTWSFIWLNFTCARSKINCNFLPVATDKRLTQCGGDDTPHLHQSCKSFFYCMRRLNRIQNDFFLVVLKRFPLGSSKFFTSSIIIQGII